MGSFYRSQDEFKCKLLEGKGFKKEICLFKEIGKIQFGGFGRVCFRAYEFQKLIFFYKCYFIWILVITKVI